MLLHLLRTHTLSTTRRAIGIIRKLEDQETAENARVRVVMKVVARTVAKVLNIIAVANVVLYTAAVCAAAAAASAAAASTAAASTAAGTAAAAVAAADDTAAAGTASAAAVFAAASTGAAASAVKATGSAKRKRTDGLEIELGGIFDGRYAVSIHLSITQAYAHA
jgi:hypothetical protein